MVVRWPCELTFYLFCFADGHFMIIKIVIQGLDSNRTTAVYLTVISF
jgi:hypothetical protein